MKITTYKFNCSPNFDLHYLTLKVICALCWSMGSNINVVAATAVITATPSAVFWVHFNICSVSQTECSVMLVF
jgi:hypothetical protein